MGGSRRRSAPPPPPPPPQPVTSAPKASSMEDNAMQLEADTTGSGKLSRRRKGKRALVGENAAAQVGGEGMSGLNIPKG